MTFWDLEWLPDGSGIVYSSGRRGSMARLYRVVSPAEEPVLVLVGANVREIATARQAPRLVYTQVFEDHNIWRTAGPVSDERGAPMRLIASTRLDWEPQYSPDGSRVAFASNRSGEREIWICDAAGGNCRELSSIGPADTPRWSPNGRQIAFYGETDEGNPDVHVVEVDSGSVGRLTDDPNNDGPSCWSRDGQWVYFTSNRTGSVQVWKVAAAGGETRQITRNGGAFALESEDGRFLYYNKEFGYSSIWRVPVDGGEETLILDERIFPRHWALWGTKLVFLLDESANGGASIRSYDLMTGKLEELTSLPRDVPLSLGLSVSADGRWILYSQLDVSGSDLVLVDDFY